MKVDIDKKPNEKFPIKNKKTYLDELKQALEEIEEASFRFACFVDHFRRFVEKFENEKH